MNNQPYFCLMCITLVVYPHKRSYLSQQEKLLKEINGCERGLSFCCFCKAILWQNDPCIDHENRLWSNLFFWLLEFKKIIIGQVLSAILISLHDHNNERSLIFQPNRVNINRFVKEEDYCLPLLLFHFLKMNH